MPNRLCNYSLPLVRLTLFLLLWIGQSVRRSHLIPCLPIISIQL